MFRVFPRRSHDVRYFTTDPAHELTGLRDGEPGWWLRGSGDTRSPDDVARVLTTTPRATITGYDVIVAAPRPVSILVAIDPLHAPGVIRAHRASVIAAVNYLEERALVVRDRRNHDDRETKARWQSVVSFTHGINRHGEPHLHDHVLVGARPAEANTVLDSRSLFAHIEAADALYRASLRYELGARTPWRAWRSFAGIEHVRDLDEGYRALWGGHHSERAQKVLWDRSDVQRRWRSDMERFDPQGSITDPHHGRSEFDEHSFAGAFEGRIAVARRHVVAAWSNAAVYGQDPSVLMKGIDALYPVLQGSRGVRETTIGLNEARMIETVREHGPRPTRAVELEMWIQRSRERSRGVDRSRER